MASTVMAEITRSDLNAIPESISASISDVDHLSSYNWVDAPVPTIAVPGSPPLWSPPIIPQQLEKDSGLVYIDQNAARHLKSPLEPLFRALSITCPCFDLRSIDIVTDRNNIHKLLWFVKPELGGGGLSAFTIRVECIKNTAIFSRQEAEASVSIAPNEFKGYGHEFERAYTTNQTSGSSGHYRIIRYRFGGLNLIVRHKTDGCVATTTSPYPSRKEPRDDSLPSTLTDLSLSSPNDIRGTSLSGSKLTIRNEGQTVPLESTLEIKTRVAHKGIEIRDVAWQLWTSQTPKLVRAYHHGGKFRKPEVEDVMTEIKKWEEVHQDDLRKLAALISRIVKVAKECGGNTVIEYDGVGDKLLIHKVAMKKVLPEDLYSKWDGASVDMARPEATLKVEDQAKTPAERSTKKPEIEHRDFPFFDIIAHAKQNGFRHFFRRLPCELADYHLLCESLDSLAVDVLRQQKLQDVVRELKTGDDDYDPEERTVIRGCKGNARNAAFALLYLFLSGQLESSAPEKNVAYNATQYVVSHRRKFKYRTRKMVRAAFEERFEMTPKQRAGLDKWAIGEASQGGGEDSDKTTEEEVYGFWSSDSSF